MLKKAGVVDAGAKGFVALVHGMTEFIRHGRIVEEPDLSLIDYRRARRNRGRHARICLPLTAPNASLRAPISTAASSARRSPNSAIRLVLAGTKRKAKIHIHVDEPEQVFDVARGYGKVSAEKADDMHRQQMSSHDANRRFAVITDSAADIT